ncbi:MAG: hypothetical protein ACOCXD_00400 [Bacteroidota bacterium]
MKSIIPALILLVISITLYPQKAEPFIDHATGLVGLRAVNSEKVIVDPGYLDVSWESDTIFVFKKTDGTFGVLNGRGETLIDFGENPIHLNTFDDYFLYRPLEMPSFIEGRTNNRWYFINKQRQCVPEDYYPCPYGVKSMPFNQLPPHLVYIQKAEYFRAQSRFDSAVFYVEKAIETVPDNPYPYYYGANLFLNNQQENVTYENNEQYNNYYGWIANCLEKANNLETERYHKIRINNLRYRFYKHNVKKPHLYKNVENELSRYNPEIESSGIHLLAGFAYNHDPFLEIGIVDARWRKKSGKGRYGHIGLGFSIQKNLTRNIDAYKFYFYALRAPVTLGLHPVFYTDYQSNELALRPEAGFSIGSLSLSYGYNLLLDKQQFTPYKTHHLSLNYTIPLWIEKNFSAR